MAVREAISYKKSDPNHRVSVCVCCCARFAQSKSKPRKKERKKKNKRLLPCLVLRKSQLKKKKIVKNPPSLLLLLLLLHPPTWLSLVSLFTSSFARKGPASFVRAPRFFDLCIYIPSRPLTLSLHHHHSPSSSFYLSPLPPSFSSGNWKRQVGREARQEGQSLSWSSSSLLD